MATPQQQGLDFERDLADEFGLKPVVSSGSTWHSKLDLSGPGTRWSLKFTTKEKWPLTFRDILEAIAACFGPGGDGSTPIWAVRVIDQDFIVLRKEDFKLMQAGYSKLINIIEQDKPQVARRKRNARTPELLREED